jgi:hypothetical protein
MEVEAITGQPIVAISCLLSLVSMTKRFLDMARFACRQCRQNAVFLSCSPVATVLALVLCGLIAWNVVRLFFDDTCPHHAWRLRSGCFSIQ